MGDKTPQHFTFNCSIGSGRTVAHSTQSHEVTRLESTSQSNVASNIRVTAKSYQEHFRSCNYLRGKIKRNMVEKLLCTLYASVDEMSCCSRYLLLFFPFTIFERFIPFLCYFNIKCCLCIFVYFRYHVYS